MLPWFEIDARLRRGRMRARDFDHLRIERGGSVVCRSNVDVLAIDHTTGARQHQRKHNLVPTAGLNFIADFLNGTAGAGLGWFAVGTGTDPTSPTDTALQTEVFRDVTTTKSRATAATLVVTYFLPTGSANGYTLTEAGLFNAASAGTMYARVVLATSITKTNAVSVTFTWTLSFAT